MRVMKKNKEKSNIMIFNILLIVIYVLLTVTGLILFKLGTNEGVSVSFSSGNLSVLLNFKSIIGLLCYVCSFLLYMVLVSKFNLSYIFPITQGVTYVLIFLSSIAIFKEKITTQGIIGILLVIVGIILLNIKR